MKNIKEYIDSGIIENYVLGLTDASETAELELLAGLHTEIFDANEDFSLMLEQYMVANAVAPPVTIKPLLLATIDYIDRLKNGEASANPPLLNENSRLSDYAEWLNRADLVPAKDYDGIFVKLIGYNPKCTSAIVWIKEMAPAEVHDDELERFLIVEGTCTITIGEVEHKLVAGNFLVIPLHVWHNVKVTSSIPCKVILQRVAA